MSRLFFSSQTLSTAQVHTALDALSLPTLGVEVLNHQACIEIPEAYTLPKAAITDTLRPLACTHQFDFAILEAEFQAGAGVHDLAQCKDTGTCPASKVN